MGYLCLYLPCIFERTELKESLRFIGTPSAKVTIAVVETYDLLLNHLRIVFFLGNRCCYVFWLCFLAVGFDTSHFQIWVRLPSSSLTSTVQPAAKQRRYEATTLPNCPDRLFCCLYCHVLDLLIMMIYDNQSDRKRRMIDKMISLTSRSIVKYCMCLELPLQFIFRTHNNNAMAELKLVNSQPCRYNRWWIMGHQNWTPGKFTCSAQVTTIQQQFYALCEWCDPNWHNNQPNNVCCTEKMMLTLQLKLLFNGSHIQRIDGLLTPQTQQPTAEESRGEAEWFTDALLRGYNAKQTTMSQKREETPFEISLVLHKICVTIKVNGIRPSNFAMLLITQQKTIFIVCWLSHVDDGW